MEQETMTKSVCPVCLRTLPAQRVETSGKILLVRDCPDHGHFAEPIWSEEVPFATWGTGREKSPAQTDSQPCPSGCVGCNAHLVRLCCVLLEVTQRCDLGCPVCFASAEHGHEARGHDSQGSDADPSLEQIAFWYDSLLRQAGVCHIQLSGGEPTLRDDLDEIIRLGVARGFEYFQLNTNGLCLAADSELAPRLKKAGLTCVFLQFDGISEKAQRLLRGADLLTAKEQAIKNCAAANLPVVLVPTLAKGANEDQLSAILAFAIRKSPTVRGIHIQPLSRFGRFPDGLERLTIPEVLTLLEEQTAGMTKVEHFFAGSVENPHCSFSANYLIGDDGRLEVLGSKAATSFCCGSPVEPEPAPAVSCCGSPEPEALPTSCCGSQIPDAVDRAQDIQKRRWGTKLEAIPAERPAPGSLDEFLWQTKARGFSITGMAFMDAWTLDIERLHSCYIFVLDAEGNPIPFCAYNLTNAEGVSPYRQRGSHGVSTQ